MGEPQPFDGIDERLEENQLSTHRRPAKTTQMCGFNGQIHHE